MVSIDYAEKLAAIAHKYGLESLRVTEQGIEFTRSAALPQLIAAASKSIDTDRMEFDDGTKPTGLLEDAP